MACAMIGAATARAEDIEYPGRWTLSDARQNLSANSKPYRTLDLVPCGEGRYCGVSVAQNGACGAMLFRVISGAPRDDRLIGTGQWGKEKHQIFLRCEAASGSTCSGLSVTISNRFAFASRRESMPLLAEEYQRTSAASCTAE